MVESSPIPVDLTEIVKNVGGKMEVLGVLVDHILVEFPKKISAIRSAIAEKDAVGLQQLAHALKSPLASFGAENGRRLAAELEALGGRGDLGGAAELLWRLEEETTSIVGFFSDPSWKEKVSVGR